MYTKLLVAGVLALVATVIAVAVLTGGNSSASTTSSSSGSSLEQTVKAYEGADEVHCHFWGLVDLAGERTDVYSCRLSYRPYNDHSTLYYSEVNGKVYDVTDRVNLVNP